MSVGLNCMHIYGKGHVCCVCGVCVAQKAAGDLRLEACEAEEARFLSMGLYTHLWEGP